MEQIFSDEKLRVLKQKKQHVIWCLLAVSLIFVLGIVVIFIFQSRATQNLFIFLGTLITFAYAVFLLLEIKEIIIPINNYMRLISAALRFPPLSVEGLFDSESNETYLGLACRKLTFIKQDGQQAISVYIEKDEPFCFQINLVYNLHIYHNFIVAYGEVKSHD